LSYNTEMHLITNGIVMYNKTILYTTYATRSLLNPGHGTKNVESK